MEWQHVGGRATGAATDRIKETAMTVDPEDRSSTGATPPTRRQPPPAPEQQPVPSDGPGWSTGPSEPVGGPTGSAGPNGPTGQTEPSRGGGPAGPDGASATRPAVDPPLAKPHHTRLSGLWITLTSGAVVLLVLLIFILENGQKVEISFFGAHGHLPLGVALLMAAIFGVLIVVIPGAGRMIQLRMLAKRHRKQVAALPPRQVEPNRPGADAPADGYGPPAGQAPNGNVRAEEAPQPKKSRWGRSQR